MFCFSEKVKIDRINFRLPSVKFYNDSFLYISHLDGKWVAIEIVLWVLEFIIEKGEDPWHNYVFNFLIVFSTLYMFLTFVGKNQTLGLLLCGA